LTGPIGRIVRARRRELVEVAASHGASNLRVFGSVARGDDRPDSDVDLLADLPPPWVSSGWDDYRKI
jgi:predicted nucleotidyltransferase